jgi:hypothetical protein
MTTDIFTAGVTNIALRYGMVRIEFGTVAATEVDTEGNPTVFSRSQITLTPKAFLDTFNNMERMQHLMIEREVLKDTNEEEQRSGPARDTETEFTAKIGDKAAENEEHKAPKFEINCFGIGPEAGQKQT